MVITPPPHPPKWNEERRTAFLETLADSSNIAASERRRSPEFRAAWDEALCEGYARLELVLLERALGGVVERREVGAASAILGSGLRRSTGDFVSRGIPAQAGRAGALVWALTALLLERSGEPKVRLL